MVTTTLTMSGAALRKAGLNVNGSLSAGLIFADSDFIVDLWIAGAEGTINTITRYNWVDNYATLNNDVKYMLNDTASDLAAINCINYDMSGYTSRAEAITMMNVLRDNAVRKMELLKEKETQDFITEA